MRIKKVTEEVFDKVKQETQAGHISDVAQINKLSATTVRNISNCDSYEDYLDLITLHYDKTFSDKVRDMHLREVKGEPLFWKVHSDCRNIPVWVIRAYSDLSADTIKTMKKAPDYETFLKMEGKESYMSRKPSLTAAMRLQIIKMLNEGYETKEICQLLDIPESLVIRAQEKKNKVQKKIWTNEALWEIIRAGIEKGVSYDAMKRELPISLSTYYRVKNGAKFAGKGGLITREIYDLIKAGKKNSSNGSLLKAVRNSKNFEEFSLEWYGKVKTVSWMDSKPEPVKKDKYADYKNEWFFKMVHRGDENGASVEEMAQLAGIPVNIVQEMLTYPTWKEYIAVVRPSYVISADKDIFDDIIEFKNGKFSLEAIRAKWNCPKVISDMSRFDNFGDYLVFKFFKGIEPSWLEKKAAKMEVPEPEEEKPVEQKLNEEMANMTVEQETRKIEAPVEDKVEVETEKEDVTDLLNILTKIASEKNKSEEMKYKLLRFKYLGIFILTGIAILGLLALGYLLVAKA